MEKSPWTLTARWVFPVDRPPLERGLVTIGGERIVAVEEAGARTADMDLGETAILPGLVNAHTHLDLTGARGLCPPAADVVGWLRRVVAYRQSRTQEQVEEDIRAGIRESVAAGVTLLGDISHLGWSLPVLSDASCHAVVFYELLGLTQERAEENIAKAWDWRNRVMKPGLSLGLSPHAPYSVNDWLFERAALMAFTCDLPVAIHLTESREELELLEHRRGPLVEFLQEMGVWNPDGLVQSVADLMRNYRHGTRVLWIHGNYLCGAEEVPEHHTLVYCPRTHAAFGHPPHPFRKFLERGVRVALATDSLASNLDLDILAEARFVHQRHPDLPGDVLLRMITLSGAEALGWADGVGSLTPGKSADLVVLPLRGGKVADPHQHIFDNDAKVARVMMGGKWLEPVYV